MYTVSTSIAIADKHCTSNTCYLSYDTAIAEYQNLLAKFDKSFHSGILYKFYKSNVDYCINLLFINHDGIINDISKITSYKKINSIDAALQKQNIIDYQVTQFRY